jgi:hypothetical protein
LISLNLGHKKCQVTFSSIFTTINFTPHFQKNAVGEILVIRKPKFVASFTYLSNNLKLTLKQNIDKTKISLTAILKLVLTCLVFQLKFFYIGLNKVNVYLKHVLFNIPLLLFLEIFQCFLDVLLWTYLEED